MLFCRTFIRKEVVEVESRSEHRKCVFRSVMAVGEKSDTLEAPRRQLSIDVEKLPSLKT